MKKQISKRVTSLLAAASMVLSTSAAFNAFAADSGADAYNELYAHSRLFRVDNEVFNSKYLKAKERLDNDPSFFDYSVNAPYANGTDINYIDYQQVRDVINELYSTDGFKKTSFPLSEIADYNTIKCDIDGDQELSYYDYCCMLRYIQEKVGLTDKFTDLNNKDHSSERLGLIDGHGGLEIKKIESQSKYITIPSEICCKLITKNEKNENVESWCILPVLKIKKGAFSECTNMEKLTIRNYVQPKWFYGIETYDHEPELYTGGLKTISTGGKVTASTFINIEDGAFEGCSNLDTVNFQENVNFSYNVFNGTKFGNKQGNHYDDGVICYIKSSDEKAVAACGTVDDIELADSNNDGIFDLNIADKTTTITNNLRAVLNNDNNKDKTISLNIPDTVKYIHEDAFSNCCNIKYLNGNDLDYYQEQERENIYKDRVNGAEKYSFYDLIVKNNGSFKRTQLLADHVQQKIDFEVSEIKNAYDNEKDRIEAACRIIFNSVEYSSYVNNTEKFDLFPNYEYNILDESRENDNSAYNAFLSNYTQCESFAMAVSLLLDGLGVDNFILGCSGHAANLVFVDKKWQIIDMSVYGDFDRNEKLLERSGNTSFVREIYQFGSSDNRYYITPVQPLKLFSLSNEFGYYPGAAVCGKNQLGSFRSNKMLTSDCSFNIVDVNSDRSCLTIELPLDYEIPEPIKNAVSHKKIKLNFSGVRKENGSYYFYKKDKKYTQPGMFTYNNKTYYVNNDGTLAYNKIVDVIENGKTEKYWFNNECERTSGWYNNGNNYYLFGKNHNMITDAYISMYGNYYHFDKSGVMDAKKLVDWKYNIKLYANQDGELDLSKLYTDDLYSEFINGLKEIY